MPPNAKHPLDHLIKAETELEALHQRCEREKKRMSHQNRINPTVVVIIISAVIAVVLLANYFWPGLLGEQEDLPRFLGLF